MVAEVYGASDLLFFFFTGTTLISQVGCWMGFRKPISKSFWISYLICTSSSDLKFLETCFTSLVPSLIWVYAWWGEDRAWHLEICPCKDILEFLQNNKNCLPQLGWQIGTEKDGVWLFSLSSKIYLDKLFALVFDLSCPGCSGWHDFHQSQLPNLQSKECYRAQTPKKGTDFKER